MTPEQIEIVERTFAKFAPVTTAAGLAFYARLFAVDPSTRALFGKDMESQAMRLMQVLAYSVSNLHAPEALLATVRELGQRHAGYGVTDAHYASFGVALLGMLAEALGPAWSPDVEEAWATTYRTISAEMKYGSCMARDE